MTSWAFATVGRGSTTLFAQVSIAARELLGELPPRSLASITWSLASSNFKDSELFSFVARRSLELLEEFAAFDMSTLCWAFAQADESATGVAAQMFPVMAQRAVDAGLVHGLAAPIAAELTWAFAA